jgi:tRNA pseudouridine38-40 synthase
LNSFKITLAYDGTDFVGWQRQASGRSIQGLLEEALRELDGRDITVTGAGRTDAGVHAHGQVASFALERAIEPAVLVRALNARLPETVRVWSACRVAPTFNARFDARAKRYRYRICNGPFISPFDRQYAWHISGTLDPGAMADAARRLEGRHDFAAFQGAGSEVATTERIITISRIVVPGMSTSEEAEDAEEQSRRYESQPPPVELPDIGLDLRVLGGDRLITYEVTGDGFLRHMVRNIVGTLVDVGLGRRMPESIDAVLATRDRSAAGQTAPARGLFLVAAEYGALAAEP